MATHSSVLAWRIPGTREPGGGVAKSGVIYSYYEIQAEMKKNDEVELYKLS